jgi:DNA-binding MarR family transcriptional regulator
MGIYPFMSEKRPRVDDFATILNGLSGLPAGMTLPLLKTLLMIAARPGLSVNELAEQLGLPQQSASRYVAILQGRYQTSAEEAFSTVPLLELEVSTSDPRKRALFLTKSGNSAAEKLLREIRGSDEI